MTKTELNKLKKSELIDLLLEHQQLSVETAPKAPEEPIIWALALRPTGRLSRFDVYRLKTQGDRVLEKELLERDTLKKRALTLYNDEGFFTFIHKGGYYEKHK